VGEGSFGIVYKVRDLKSGEILVMKQIKITDDPGDLNLKLQECDVIKNLRHTNVNRYRYHFVASSQLCIFFDFCDRGTLD